MRLIKLSCRKSFIRVQQSVQIIILKMEMLHKFGACNIRLQKAGGKQKQFFVLAPKFFPYNTSVAFTFHFMVHFAIVIALNMNKKRYTYIRIPLCREGICLAWTG